MTHSYHKFTDHQLQATDHQRDLEQGTALRSEASAMGLDVHGIQKAFDYAKTQQVGQAFDTVEDVIRFAIRHKEPSKP